MNELELMTTYSTSLMLRNLLKETVAYIKFTKVDGTERTIKGTLRQDLLPPYEESTSPKSKNDNIISVWDLENEGWRSFRYDSVIEVTVI